MRGARGGVTLARTPKEINLLEVVEAIDGPILLNECVSGTHDCPIDSCVMQKIWSDAQKDLVGRLQSTNFGDLIKQRLPIS